MLSRHQDLARLVFLAGFFRVSLDGLQRLQNRAVRVLTNTCYDADANQLLKELGWDNLETRRQKLKAEMVYKSLNGLAPQLFVLEIYSEE